MFRYCVIYERYSRVFYITRLIAGVIKHALQRTPLLYYQSCRYEKEYVISKGQFKKNRTSNPMLWYSLELSSRDDSNKCPKVRVWRRTNGFRLQYIPLVWSSDYLNLYQTANFYTGPNSKHLQNTKTVELVQNIENVF